MVSACMGDNSSVEVDALVKNTLKISEVKKRGPQSLLPACPPPQKNDIFKNKKILLLVKETLVLF